MAFDATAGSTKLQRRRIARRSVLKAGLGSGMALAATRGLTPVAGAAQDAPVKLTYLHHEHPPVNTLEEELIQQY